VCSTRATSVPVGYAGTQLIGGSLADRYGGKLVLATGVVAWSAFTFLTPDAAVAGSVTLISCRIAMGFGEV
jgi:MFS transporter, ACS family, solute carrier family 17 (sodium-dependent inorganic phosphate cotransporter), other